MPAPLSLHPLQHLSPAVSWLSAQSVVELVDPSRMPRPNNAVASVTMQTGEGMVVRSIGKAAMCWMPVESTSI